MTASFSCPRCGAVSHHPDDVAQGYCGRCHDWTAPAGRPFGRPSEALQAGACPMCLGAGETLKLVPVEEFSSCSLCHGTGRWPPSEPEPAAPSEPTLFEAP